MTCANVSPSILAAFLAGCISVVCAATPAAYAAAPSPHAALDAAFASSEDDALTALRTRGATFDEVLVMEQTSAGVLAAEVALGWKGRTMRYPLMLKRRDDPETSCAQWEVAWTPTIEFTMALGNMATSGQLPEVAEAPSWHQAQRLPTLPVILTRYQIITPYGSVRINEATEGVDAARRGAAIAPPPELVTHTKRWLNEFLAGNESAASVDIITDRRASWQDLTRVVYGVASEGMFKLYLIVQTSKGLAAVETAAPIFDSLPNVTRPVPLVIGYVPQPESAAPEEIGFRISQGSAVLEDEDACAPKMSFCVTDTSGFAARLETLGETMRAKKPGNPAFALFATTGEVTVGEALPWLATVGEALGLMQRRVFIGYIGD